MEQFLRDRSSTVVFVAGCIAVTIGVLLHLPMYWMGRATGFRLAGMAMDLPMLVGMVLIVAGVVATAWGLLPRRVAEQMEAARHIRVSAPEDAVLNAAHWKLMAVLVIALVIDVMKPASLGFVLPGTTEEYGVSRATAALVPFAALSGTVVGSVLWGVIADFYGRKATIMLSAVMFVGTSICGSMPSLQWNIAMCFMMGAAAGGMLPVTFALLAETMPSGHRGWALVFVGGLGTAGGYFAASGFAAALEPAYGWRILWLLNLPTGLLLLLLGRQIPESAKFLLSRGRREEARAAMARFGTRTTEKSGAVEDVDFTPIHLDHEPHPGGIWQGSLAGRTAALTTLSLSWGLINFGLLLWLPGELVARGLAMDTASRLIAESALIALPTVFLVALAYSRWSTRGTLLVASALSAVGLLGILALDMFPSILSPVPVLAALIVGTNALLAILLPYAAESYPLHIRGRATGWIAACTKAGGLAAQGLSIAALTPSLGTSAAVTLLPLLMGLFLAWRYCGDTRGLDLRQVDRMRS